MDAFPFDEWSGVGHDRSALVWGNAAFGCAEILARRALAGGAEPGDTDIDDLPAVVASGRDGPALVPCAEAFLGEGAVVGLLERGVMTWISDRAIPRARLVRLQSLADPPTAIPGVGG